MRRSVEVVDQTANGIASEPVAELVKAVLAAEDVEGYVEVAFVDEATIKDLNTRYREQASPPMSSPFAMPTRRTTGRSWGVRTSRRESTSWARSWSAPRWCDDTPLREMTRPRAKWAGP